MIHARKDYNDLKALSKRIPKDEPVFLIRGQDALAVDTLRYYAQCLEEKNGCPFIVEAVRKHAHLMEEWPKKKLPDLPELP